MGIVVLYLVFVSPHVAEQLTMMYGTINKQTNDKSPVQLRENSESFQHNKYAYVDIQQINTGLNFITLIQSLFVPSIFICS